MSVFRRMRIDGGTLRSRLLLMVVIPLLAGSTLATVDARALISTADRAGRAQTLVRTASLLDLTRGAILNELVPSITRVAMNHPGLASPLASPDALKNILVPSAAQILNLRHITDASISTLAAETGSTALPTTVRSYVTRLRAKIGAATDGAGAFGYALTIVSRLAGYEQNRVAAAVRTGVTGAALRDIDDLSRVATVLQFAELEMPALASTVFTASPKLDVPARLWVKTWGGYEAALQNVLEHGQAAIITAVRQATSTPSARQIEAATVKYGASPATTPIPVMASMYYATQVRDDALVAVLALAVRRAVSAAATQRHAATVAMWAMGALMSFLLLLSLITAWLVQRSLSKPLERLARAARQVSQGVLEDVAVDGPHEVRTAARGLGAAVASLRNIEAQAKAVAAGELDSAVVRQQSPGPLGAVVQASIETIIDAIHDRDIAQSDLAYSATHDALTDLPNRGQALLMIEQALHRAQRTGATTGLMFVDLDHFKAVNDGFGHDVGDDVLRLAARRMLDVVRAGDTVARFGGDEFVVLLEHVASEADFVELAERVIESVSEPMVIKHNHIAIGASIGVAVCRDGYVDSRRLIAEADAAVYRGKQSGRGKVEIFDDDLRQSLAARAAIDTAILEGLTERQFELFYQPVVELPTGRLTGFEALIRWHRPGHGLVQPDDFIPQAENSALINKIGVWTLQEATAQLVGWDAETGNTALTVAVNISGRHLVSSQLLGDVRAALEQSGLAPHRLVLEITETVLVDDPLATANMVNLRALGVQISIDDFGTGYTSIGQLPHLPIDTIKIDRSFVNSSDPANAHLVRLIVAAAHAFNLNVVAEGVEVVENVQELDNCAVDSAQGFFFGRPQPATEAVALARIPALPAGTSTLETQGELSPA